MGLSEITPVCLLINRKQVFSTERPVLGLGKLFLNTVCYHLDAGQFSYGI